MYLRYLALVNQLRQMHPLKSVCHIFVFCLITGGITYLPVHAQTATSFDSTLQAIQSIRTDSTRKKALLSYEKKINRTLPEKALLLDSILLGEATKANNKVDEMKSLYRISVQYNMLNNFTASISYSFKALDLAQQLNDYESEGLIYINQSNVYAETGDTLNEHTTIQKALNIATAHRDSLMERDALNELGIFYNKQGLHEKAIEDFQASFNLSVMLHDEVSEVNSIVNLAIAFKGEKQYAKAQNAYDRGIVIADSLHDDYVKAVIVDNMANLEFEMGDFVSCEKNALIAIRMSYQVEEKEIRVDVYALLEKLYEKEKRYPEAIDYFGKLAALKDSLVNEENLAQINEMNQKYQAQIKDKQIKTQQAEIGNERELNVILGGGGIAILLVAGLIYFNLRKTARLNRTVSSQRDTLGKQSEALSVMMRELHHRVKNNLQIVSSLLNLQSLKLTDAEAVNAVQESKQRVQAMSLIHQRLYKTDDITRINMKDYIKELADFLAVSYGYNPDNFNLELDAEEEWIDIDKALPLGLILNELVTNAFKYAFTGIEKPCLKIGLKRTAGNIQLHVKDNGRGMLQEQWDDKKSTSFGKQLVKALCSQLRAKEILDVTGGTSFTFIIPEIAA